MKLYKILENGHSCHGGSLKWSLPIGDKPGDWHEVQGEIEMCKTGIHLTDRPFKWYRWDCTVYDADYEGTIIWDKEQAKCVVRKARLLKEVPHPDWWDNVHRFVEKDIPSIPWLKPDNTPLKGWKLFEADSWAAAGAAALIARIEIVKDLKISKKHIDHANRRWEVWRKGYALLCDINGVLYVYAKKAVEDTK